MPQLRCENVLVNINCRTAGSKSESTTQPFTRLPCNTISSMQLKSSSWPISILDRNLVCLKYEFAPSSTHRHIPTSFLIPEWNKSGICILSLPSILSFLPVLCVTSVYSEVTSDQNSIILSLLTNILQAAQAILGRFHFLNTLNLPRCKVCKDRWYVR